jgi:hypothetical protein
VGLWYGSSERSRWLSNSCIFRTFKALLIGGSEHASVLQDRYASSLNYPARLGMCAAKSAASSANWTATVHAQISYGSGNQGFVGLS